MLTHGSLFSGIGGFDLVAEWAGWENIFHCEINPFGRQVLKYYWPKSISYHDIKLTDFTIHRGTIDVLTGGFPCQPYSAAGKRLGTEDERHLWPEMLRAIREIQPRWVVGENVRGLTNWNGGLVFNEVQTDLEAEGYEVLPFLLPASGVNAPHRRDRVWIVAYSVSNGYKLREFRNNRQAKGEGEGIENKREWIWNDNRRAGKQGLTSDSSSKGFQRSKINRKQSEYIRFKRFSKKQNATDTNGKRLRGESNRFGDSKFFGENSKGYDWSNFPTQSPICSRNDGISTELVRQRIREDSLGLLSEKEIDKIISKANTEFKNESIKAYGNAIVSQVIYQIFKSINQYEQI